MTDRELLEKANAEKEALARGAFWGTHPRLAVEVGNRLGGIDRETGRWFCNMSYSLDECITVVKAMDLDTIHQYTGTNEIAALRAEVARLRDLLTKAGVTMQEWHREMTALRSEAANLRELLGNYKGEEDQPL